MIDYGAIAARTLHPTRIAVLEAFDWIEEPMSPSLLVQVFDGTEVLGTVAYHVKSLRKLGVLEDSGGRAVRGAWEHFYALAPSWRLAVET